MIVLGVNGVDGIFHDASATLVADNRIVASVEEERFSRKKHADGIPFRAIEFCLRKAGITAREVDAVGYYLDPDVLRKTFYDDVLRDFRCDAAGIAYYAAAAERIAAVPAQLAGRFGFRDDVRFCFMNHHVAHASSAYHTSRFDEAAILTVDGSGDRETSALYHGRGPELRKVAEFLVYPYSLGFIYTVVAAHVGLGWIEGPGKLMGLAGYGNAEAFRWNDIIVLRDDSHHPVDIDLSFFDYHVGGKGFSAKGLERFGPVRQSSEPLEQSHADLAASIQSALTEAVVHLARTIPAHLPGVKNACFAGGVALNLASNRGILDTGLFGALHVPPPAYDGGTSLGCALRLNTDQTGHHPYDFDPYTGPDIERDYDIPAALRACGERILWETLSEDELCERAAALLVQNKIIGWAHGRMECGPRALGNRSILTNVMNPKAKDELNSRVKKREAFRPYAPAVLRERAAEWFDVSDSPFMLLEARVHADKRERVPGIVHVDGTARPQTVERGQNPRFYRLLDAFYRRTGTPLVLNTSFNRPGEPIVNTPEEAIADLLQTDMDALFLGHCYVRSKVRSTREEGPPLEAACRR